MANSQILLANLDSSNIVRTTIHASDQIEQLTSIPGRPDSLIFSVSGHFLGGLDKELKSPSSTSIRDRLCFVNSSSLGGHILNPRSYLNFLQITHDQPKSSIVLAELHAPNSCDTSFLVASFVLISDRLSGGKIECKTSNGQILSSDLIHLCSSANTHILCAVIACSSNFSSSPLANVELAIKTGSQQDYCWANHSIIVARHHESYLEICSSSSFRYLLIKGDISLVPSRILSSNNVKNICTNGTRLRSLPETVPIWKLRHTITTASPYRFIGYSNFLSGDLDSISRVHAYEDYVNIELLSEFLEAKGVPKLLETCYNYFLERAPDSEGFSSISSSFSESLKTTSCRATCIKSLADGFFYSDEFKALPKLFMAMAGDDDYPFRILDD